MGGFSGRRAPFFVSVFALDDEFVVELVFVDEFDVDVDAVLFVGVVIVVTNGTEPNGDSSICGTD